MEYHMQHYYSLRYIMHIVKRVVRQRRVTHLPGGGTKTTWVKVQRQDDTTDAVEAAVPCVSQHNELDVPGPATCSILLQSQHTFSPRQHKVRHIDRVMYVCN